MAAALDTVFKTQIEEKTDGAVKVEVYHDGLLGDEAALWQGVRDGSVDFTVVGTPMNQEFPMMLISDWPFLYRDLEHAMNVWTGEVADEVSAAFDEKFPEVEMLSWGNSARTFTSNKPLTCVEDFAGQKFRMPNNPIHIGIVEDLGASAQVISLGELFTALETGTVDGQDNGMVTVVAQSFQEVQKYLYETNHIVATLEIIGNKNAMSKLTEEQQQVVRDAAKPLPSRLGRTTLPPLTLTARPSSCRCDRHPDDRGRAHQDDREDPAHSERAVGCQRLGSRSDREDRSCPVINQSPRPCPLWGARSHPE